MNFICVSQLIGGNCYINVDHIKNISADPTGKRTYINIGDDNCIVVDVNVDLFMGKFLSVLNEGYAIEA